MRKKYNKEDIIAKGASLIRRSGYHQTGINEILQAVGIPKGSFYNFFKSKEEFAELIIEHYGSMQTDFIKSHLEEPGVKPSVRLRNLYTAIMEANRSEGFRYGCLVNNMSMETAGHNEKLALKNAIQFDSWLVEIAKTIKEGQEAGEFRNDYEAKDLADFIHSNLYGALSREKMLRSANTTQKNLEKTLRFLEDK